MRTLPAFALLLIGCASLRASREQEAPPGDAEVSRLELRFHGEEGRGNVLLDLTLENRGARQGQVSQLDWEVWLAGRYFAAGTEVLSVALAAGERRRLELELPVVVRAGPLTEPRTVRATVRGHLVIQRIGFDRSAPFERTLTLEGTRVPASALESPEE